MQTGRETFCRGFKDKQDRKQQSETRQTLAQTLAPYRPRVELKYKRDTPSSNSVPKLWTLQNEYILYVCVSVGYKKAPRFSCIQVRGNKIHPWISSISKGKKKLGSVTIYSCSMFSILTFWKVGLLTVTHLVVSDDLQQIRCFWLTADIQQEHFTSGNLSPCFTALNKWIADGAQAEKKLFVLNINTRH